MVTPKDAAQDAGLLRTGASHGLALTFHSDGTGLFGQATDDRIAVDIRHSFRGIEIFDDGGRVRVQPGATVRAVTPAWPATADNSAPRRPARLPARQAVSSPTTPAA
ncbi:FAD-binding protein [Streptomyces scopuliridis]|uniref:FAD-binding protein n=1 Tax=Streptomyces scopuliridis TaxID=452529 RepID=UPI0036C35A37